MFCQRFLSNTNICKWLATPLDSVSISSLKDRDVANLALDHALFVWLYQMIHIRGGVVNGELIIEKAKEWASRPNVASCFKFSSGWLQK